MSKKELQTVLIEDKTYDVTSLTESGVKLINEINEADALIKHLQVQTRMTMTARSSLFAALKEETVNFTEVQDKE